MNMRKKAKLRTSLNFQVNNKFKTNKNYFTNGLLIKNEIFQQDFRSNLVLN